MGEPELDIWVAPSHHAPTCQCRECRGPTPLRFSGWRAGWRAALVDIRQDTRRKDFRIVAGAAFLTFAYLGRNWIEDKGPFKTVAKVLAGAFLTTLLSYYIVLPILRLRPMLMWGGNPYANEDSSEGFWEELTARMANLHSWAAYQRADYREFVTDRNAKKAIKKQEKGRPTLRKQLIKRMVNLRPFRPLNWPQKPAKKIGWNTTFENYDELEEEVNYMIRLNEDRMAR